MSEQERYDYEINKFGYRIDRDGEALLPKAIINELCDLERLAKQVETMRELLVESKFWIRVAGDDQSLLIRIDAAVAERRRVARRITT